MSTEKPVTFRGKGGVVLSGTLLLPESTRKPAPALLLLPGSGPTDRDGNQLPALRTDLLRQLAEALGMRGVASLRFDKRGIAGSGPPPTDTPLERFFDWENFVGDALAAIAFLRRQPQIAPKRIGALGHSEGGLLALEAAQKETLAALVLAATPGRKLPLVLADQLARLLKQQGATPEQTKFFLDKNAEICAAIVRTGQVPEGVPPGLAALFPKYLGPFLQGMLGCDPPALAEKCACPVLVLQGEKDVQVLAESDAPALMSALQRRTKASSRLALIPGASHNFKPVKSDSDLGFVGPIAPAARNAVLEFAKTALQSL